MFDLKQCCAMINIVSDRDFGRYNQKMSQKQTLSDIVACNLMVNKIGLQVNLKSKLKKNSANCKNKQRWQNKRI